jgi:hypothetical protein
MANNNAPFGLLPLGVENNATPSFQLNRMFVPNTIAACARGDGLQKAATGYLAPVVAAGVTAIQWGGIVWGFEYLNASLGRRIVTQYYPGSGATGDVELIYVPIGVAWPSARIVAQAAASGIFTRAMVGANMDIAYTAPSATIRGGSSLVAITAADAVTATLPWRLIGLYSDFNPNNPYGVDNASANNWGVFEFNNTGTVGI